MSYNKLSKESSLSSKSKTESFLYNTNDYLNPNAANLKEERDDLFKLLGQGPREAQEKRNSLLQDNFNFNAKEANNKILNVSEYQKNVESKVNQNFGYENDDDFRNLNKNAEILGSIIKEENDRSISSNRSENSSQKRADSLSISKSNVSDSLAKKTISRKTFSDKSRNSNMSGISSKKNEALKNEENENLMAEDIDENNNDKSDKHKNLSEKNNTENSQSKNIQNNILGLETGEINSKTLRNNIPIPGSPQKLLVPDYNMNNEEIKEEINELLNFREMEKLKLSKRRKSINIRRKSENDKKRNLEINSAAIVNMLNKEHQTSPQEKYKKYIKYIDILIAITVCFNVAISIIDNEIYISKSDAYLKEYTQKNNITSIDLETLSKIADRPISSEENGLRFINIFVVFSNLFFIYIHYHLKIKVLQQDHKLSEYENIFTSGYYKYCLFEMIICGIFYPPYANRVLSGEMLNLIYVYNFNALISFIVMLKCYIILRVYSYFSRWTSDAAKSVCAKNNVKGGIHFAVKAELKKRTYTMLTIMMLVSLTILSFALRTFEYGVKDPSNTTSLKGDGNDLQSLINCFWLMIVTMTTVGYGDYFPKSHLGRFIGVVACIIGMLIVSLIVVSLAVIAEFTNEEKKAYSLLKKLQADDNAYKKAIKVMIGVLKLRKLVVKSKQQSKKGNSLSERFILLTTLKKEISVFKNDYKIANSYSLPIDEMLKRLESKLKGDIQQLTANIKKLSSVEGELDKISRQQDSIRSKIETVMMRQDKIAKYIVKVNNDNYKRFVLLSLKEKIDENEENEQEMDHEGNMEGINENSAESSRIYNDKMQNEAINTYRSENQIGNLNEDNNNNQSEDLGSYNHKGDREGIERSVLSIETQKNEDAKSELKYAKNNKEIKKMGEKIENQLDNKIDFKRNTEDDMKINEDRIIDDSSINKVDESPSNVNEFLMKMDDINKMINNNFANNSSSLSNKSLEKNSFLKEKNKNKDSDKGLVSSGLEFYNEDLKTINDNNINLEKVYFGKLDKGSK